MSEPKTKSQRFESVPCQPYNAARYLGMQAARYTVPRITTVIGKLMTPFQTKEEFVAILSALWARIVAAPEVAEPLSKTGLVARFRFSDYEADLYLDASGNHLTFYWDPEGRPAPDVEMILSSETAHRFWMRDLNVPLAIASRKVIAKGSVQKALKLLPALKPAFSLYPVILREMGRVDLLGDREKGVKRRSARAVSTVQREKKNILRSQWNSLVSHRVLPRAESDPFTARRP